MEVFKGKNEEWRVGGMERNVSSEDGIGVVFLWFFLGFLLFECVEIECRGGGSRCGFGVFLGVDCGWYLVRVF